jgi:hypothetical protein
MNFSEKIVNEVWEKARVIHGFDADKFRTDKFGEWILKSQYGNRLSEFGWKIDLDDPAKGYELDNLIPVQWKHNLAQE